MNSRILVALGCAFALAGAASARAAAVSEADAAREIESLPTQVAIKFGDLDLASQPGSEAMLQRISHAALEACGASGFSLPDYRWAVKNTTCYRGSMDRAVADLAAPTVTQLYELHRQSAASVAASN
ncbi:UrcA family protein [Phenylobacterium sp.]|uniref:UrcA family protein n=1 Tax=Phenylobacterium sp. TaxID=1871053 RepID=UPI0012031C19|nr:UrcA family protein [Phenylobacterium sp.]THD52517.1 MAG: UrcA family protein [Phenylobacterium sp.]